MAKILVGAIIAYFLFFQPLEISFYLSAKVRQLRWPGPDELGTGRHHRGYEAGLRSGLGTAARQAPAIAHDAGGIQASLFDHDNIDGAISKVRALRREVASLGAASVSVVHGSNAGPRGPSRSAVNRAIRGGPSAGGSTFA